MIKRRTLEGNKARRPLRKHRIGETLNPSSAGTHFKVFLVWIVVIAIDYALEFRVEFFWPLWLLIRTSFDSLRFQGVGFMITFLFLVLLCDALCLFLLPNPWLLFVASNYVWVQLVWQSDRSIGAMNVIIWLLFVYVEATLRFRSSSPYLDLGRPFASQCIGYPVVTFGFGLKSFIEYKMQEQHKDAVRKENGFYFDLIQQALPPKAEPVGMETPKEEEEMTSESKQQHLRTWSRFFSWALSPLPWRRQRQRKTTPPIENVANGSVVVTTTTTTKPDVVTSAPPPPPPSPPVETKSNSLKRQLPVTSTTKVAKHQQHLPPSSDTTTNNNHSASAKLPEVVAAGEKIQKSLKRDEKTRTIDDDSAQILMRSLKADLEASRLCEEEAEKRCIQLASVEKTLKQENQRLKTENENLLQKLTSLNNAKKQDHAEISSLERKIKSEQELRKTAEKNFEEKLKEREPEVESIRERLAKSDEKFRSFRDATKQAESRNSQQMENAKKENEVLMSALSAMQEKNNQLEKSLSAETRIKLDLFSALGDAQRRLTDVEDELGLKTKECLALEQRIAEFMAVLPPDLISSSKDVGAKSKLQSATSYGAGESGLH